MEDSDIIDDVNALLKLGVGDAYRLEHIKQAYIQNKSVWITDKNYLEKMKDKYLTKHAKIITNDEDGTEKEEEIHCWKCGKKTTLGANFCMSCGASLFEVASESKVEHEPIPDNQKNNTRTIKIKIPIMIGIPILILAIVGGAYSQGVFDNTFERANIQEPKITPKVIEPVKTDSSTETNSKCGEGTVFDAGTNSCVLESDVSTTKTDSSTETNSKCGEGTVFDAGTNSCVLESDVSTTKTDSSTETNSVCGEGTVFDAGTNSCVLDK
ncbi:zinc-ribbon domain-containing protein [Nitrosopumilus sp.]|uniref:zinc-ribbon domain-containing protein n=1 Tax=Nitrosopumilus sp. TaxID=2024843 RepID=UPI003D0E9927